MAPAHIPPFISSAQLLHETMGVHFTHSPHLHLLHLQVDKQLPQHMAPGLKSMVTSIFPQNMCGTWTFECIKPNPGARHSKVSFGVGLRRVGNMGDVEDDCRKISGKTIWLFSTLLSLGILIFGQWKVPTCPIVTYSHFIQDCRTHCRTYTRFTHTHTQPCNSTVHIISLEKYPETEWRNELQMRPVPSYTS